MIESREYPVTVSWTSGRAGYAESVDGLPGLPLAAPPEFGGEEGLWTPEHLLVASVASCLMTTFLAIAELSKLEVESLEVGASGHLVRGEDRRYRFDRITVRPVVGVVGESAREKALRLLAKAEELCLITRSLSAEVQMEPRIEVLDPSGAVVR
jgi:organic hydroperoxide reductase OsmC/OhrA